MEFGDIEGGEVYFIEGLPETVPDESSRRDAHYKSMYFDIDAPEPGEEHVYDDYDDYDDLDFGIF